MRSSTTVKAIPPKPTIRKTIKINGKDFAKALGKAGTNLAFGNWEGLSTNAVDALSALGLKSTPSELAWLLLYRGFLRAIKQTIEETLTIPPDAKDAQALHQLIVSVLNSDDVSIDKSLFSDPEHHSLTSQVSVSLNAWLETQGFSIQSASAVAIRLRSYVAYAFHEEWIASLTLYTPLKESLDTPFTQATERSFGRLQYAAWLRKQVDLPVFFESFALRQVYVPLRGYYHRKGELFDRGRGQLPGDVEPSKQSKVAVDLHEELDAWIQKADPRDAVRLISGGPGSGKSSFAKMFAASQSIRNEICVLFVPLHHLEISDDLIEAIGKFIKIQNLLTINPLDWEQGEPRVLAIFDGLDELAMQGKVGERSAQEFVREVLRKTDQLNSRRFRIQTIITGRELVIQANETYFRKQGQILTVLPYFIDKKDLREGEYVDPDKILQVDQRIIWWNKYSAVTGIEYNGLPKELDKGNLVDITSQPLLNYLVALALRGGRLKLSEQVNLNAIYADLLRAIYERGWSNDQHPTIRGLQESEFTRILEEIALASWHGDGRTTTARDIHTHCNNSGLSSLLTRFQEGLESDPKSNVTQLLTAFYFRQSGHNSTGERTFEFTHKSFGEYLTARRIVREIRLIDKKIRQNDENADEGWAPRTALERWVALTGNSPIDDYVFEFICGEIESSEQGTSSLQGTLCRLIEISLSSGLPIERLTPRPNFATEVRISKNSESALLICLNACARTTHEISHVTWPNSKSFGEMIHRLVGQRSFTPHLVLRCLSYLDLSTCTLINQDFWRADFRQSDLSHANLVGSDCRYADFSGANLRGAGLVYCNFMECNFYTALLGSPEETERAEFVGSIDSPHDEVRENCFLDVANFEKANLEGINFAGLDLRSVNFTEAIALNADFSSAKISKQQYKKLLSAGARVDSSIVVEESKSKKKIRHFPKNTLGPRSRD